jgi:hypothetical protein
LRATNSHHLCVAGFAKLKYSPVEEFMWLYVEACMATRLEDFAPQALANVINGAA